MILYHCIVELINGDKETCRMYETPDEALEWAEKAVEDGINFDMMEEEGYIEVIPVRSIFRIVIQAIEEEDEK